MCNLFNAPNLNLNLNLSILIIIPTLTCRGRRRSRGPTRTASCCRCSRTPASAANPPAAGMSAEDNHSAGCSRPGSGAERQGWPRVADPRFRSQFPGGTRQSFPSRRSSRRSRRPRDIPALLSEVVVRWWWVAASSETEGRRDDLQYSLRNIPERNSTFCPHCLSFS